MRIIILIVLSWSLLISACKTSSYKPINPTSPLKNFVRLGDSRTIYYSKYETTNREYHNFLDNVCEIDSNHCKQYYFRPEFWKRITGGTANLENNYHWHSAFDEYAVTIMPVVGAKAYCEWLTKRYHSNWLRKYKKVIFRLPNREEIIKLIGSVEFDYSSDDFEYYDEINFNLGMRPIHKDGAMYQARTRKYIQNNQGACNIIGNVNELTEDGESYGSNWFAVPSIAKKSFKHKAPDPRIGFRVFMEILER